MLHENFYYMVFTRNLADKIQLPICMQDSVKPALHYQINSIRFLSDLLIECSLPHQINLMKIIISMFRIQKKKKKLVKHLRLSILQLYLSSESP